MWFLSSHNHHAQSTIAAIAFAALVATGSAMAQSLSDTEAAKGGAISVPKDLSTIEGTLAIEGEGIYTFSVLNGGTLRVENNRSGIDRGFILSAAPEGPDVPLELQEANMVAHVYKIMRTSSGRETIDHEASLPLYWSTPTESHRGYTITITGWSEETSDSRVPAISEFLEDPSLFRSLCCVSCWGHTVCGCKVTSPCGSCGSELACGCGGSATSPEHRDP